MFIQKSVDNPCSMIATINEVDSHLSSSDIVCNTIIKNTKSTNSSIFTPPHSLVNSKNHSAQIKSSIKQQKGQEPKSSRAKSQDHQEPRASRAKSQEPRAKSIQSIKRLRQQASILKQGQP